MVTDANYLAHASRILEVAKVLRDHECCDIIIAGDGRFMRLFEAEGFALEHVLVGPREVVIELARKAGLVRYSWWSGFVNDAIQSDLECIERTRPDLVVGDLHWSLKPACQMTKTPYISITNAHWTKYYGCKVRALEDHFTTNLLGRRLGSVLLNRLKKYILFYWALPFRIHGKKNNIQTKQTTSIYDIIEGDLTFLADIPEYGVTRGLPGTVKYVGPILWEPDLPDPPWISSLDPDRPAFYCTMGSTGSSNFFEDTVKAFGDSRYQVMITSGGLPLEADRFPKNYHITDFAPGRRLMEVSDLAVSHGGNGTVYQALLSGTPILGVPFHVDQELNLQRVEDLRFGRMLSPKRLTPGTLVDTIEGMLADGAYKENAMRLKAAAEAYGGARQAAGYILDALGSP